MVEERRNRGNGRRLNAIHDFRLFPPSLRVVGSNGMRNEGDGVPCEYVPKEGEWVVIPSG